MTNSDLVLLAEEYRGSLPSGFDASCHELGVLLEGGAPISTLDRGVSGSLNQRIKQAVIGELREFLCTDAERYKDVRAHGKTLTRTSITSISAYVAGAVGISAAAATACVAFVALAVAKVSVGTFCRLSEDNAGNRKGSRKRPSSVDPTN